MATAAILPSHNCFAGSTCHGNLSPPPKSGRSGRSRSGRRKKSGQPLEKRGRRTDGPAVVRFPKKDLAMEQVKILKRGEELKSPWSVVVGSVGNDGGDDLSLLKVAQDEDSCLLSTEQLGPEPEVVSKQTRLREASGFEEVYYEWSWFTSPSPDSLPRPAFLAKNLQK